MGLSVNQIDDELKELLGIDDDDYDQATRLKWINRSFWEITAKFEFREKEGTFVLPTDDGTSEYTVPIDLEAVQFVGIVGIDGMTESQMARVSKEEYLNSFNSNDSAKTVPTRYYRENNKIIFSPVPNDVYNVTIKYLKTLSDLISGGTVVLPQEWHELILFGAAYRGFLVLNDKVSAEFYRNQQANLTATTIPTEAKEEKDSRYAAVDVVTRRSNASNDAPRRSLWRGYR